MHTPNFKLMKNTIIPLHCWLIILQIVLGVSTHQIPLCCPVGWSLAKLKATLFQANKYACLDPIQSETLKNEVQILGTTLPLGGYNIQLKSNNISRIPNCRQPQLVVFATAADVQITANTCLARFDRRIAGIVCQPDVGETFNNLSFMHKCCPIDYVYDSTKRKCTVKDSLMLNHAVYADFFKNSKAGVIFIDEAINCPQDRVLVEYRLKNRNIQFQNGEILLSNLDRENSFNIQNYCVEAISNGVESFDDDDNGGVDVVDSKVGNSKILVEQLANVDGIENVERRRVQEYFVRTCSNVNICEHMACIRRCCTDGEMFTKGSATSYCKKDESDIAFHGFESMEISGNFSKPEVFGLLRSLDCQKYRLDPHSYPDEAHHISSVDGSLYVMQTKKNYTNSQYCVEKIRGSTMPDQKLYTFLCFDKKVVVSDKIRFKLYPIGLLISCFFYTMTLIVYLCISRLRNLPGRILICLVCSLLAAYMGIALGQLMPTPNDDICFASGFFVYFCLLAAFAWMNVMCFDIWQTFGSTRKSHHIQNNQNKRFLLYSTYGWGLPTTLTIITVSLTKSNLLSENLRPNFGHGRCWFTYDAVGSANILFFSGPVGILFLINLVLFTLTLRYCNRVKREIFRMQSSNMDKPVLKRRFFVDKARFAMNTKLFVVMGITWLLELLSIVFYDHKKTFFWAISDSFNVLLGVFVFFIFVFKKRVWHSVQEKFGLRAKDSTRTLQNATLATPSVYTRSTSVTRLNPIDTNTPYSKSAIRKSPLL